MNQTLRSVKQTCREYLATYSDNNLVNLIDDLRNGVVPYYEADHCLCGHKHGSDNWTYLNNLDVFTNPDWVASYAYKSLGHRDGVITRPEWDANLDKYNSTFDSLRMNRLLPMALREAASRVRVSVEELVAA